MTTIRIHYDADLEALRAERDRIAGERDELLERLADRLRDELGRRLASDWRIFQRAAIVAALILNTGLLFAVAPGFAWTVALLEASTIAACAAVYWWRCL